MVSFRAHLAARRLIPLVPLSRMIAAGALVLFLTGRAHPSDAGAALDAWIRSQRNLRTWSAEFTQTRRLRSLSQPLMATGRAWFSTPDRFRWETLTPAPTIAVRDANQMLVIYPRLKRAERYSLDASASGPMADALSLLDAGFPRDRKDFDARFRLASAALNGDCWQFHMQPASGIVRRLVPELLVSVSTNSYALTSFAITFKDGSKMETRFTDQKVNPPIGDEIFRPALSSDFKISEPLRR